MPEMDGLACCDQIRQFDQETPIIAMTANTEKTQCMTYLAHRMNDILAKPFAKEALFSMLDRYCQQLISRDDEAEGTSNQIDQASIPQFHGGLIQQHMNDGRNSLPTPLGQPQQLGAGRPAGFDFPFPQDRWPPLPSPGQGPMSAPPQFGYHQQGGAVQGSYFPVHYGAQTPGPMPGYSAQQMQHMQPRYDEELYARPGGPGAPMGQMQQQS